MAEYTDRESFIPFRKADVIEFCAHDGKLGDNQQKFREFCEILSAYYHFDYHHLLETLKDNFAPFNPDADTQPRVEPTAEEVQQNEENLVKALSQVLEKANYTKLTDEALEKALDEESLITLRLDVDFDDFDQMVFFHRGSCQETVEVKKLAGLKKIDFTMEIYERVVLLLKFKDEEYFKKKKMKVEKLNFTPGKMYVYMYKKIPQADIEVLFPNVKISMNWKDRLLLFGPAVGAAIPVLLKVLPSLLLIVGIIAATINAQWLADMFGLKSTDEANTMKVIIASLSALGVLGGFCAKQFINYKNKRIKFLKDVTDTLFFKNLDCNAGVFNTIVDAAEEEECKEAILAYYHLSVHPEGLTQEQLDDTIESWLEESCGAKVDFDVEKALKRLESMKGKIVPDGADEDSIEETPLVSKDENGVYKVVSIDDSKTIIDYIWDNIFDYN